LKQSGNPALAGEKLGFRYAATQPTRADHNAKICNRRINNDICFAKVRNSTNKGVSVIYVFEERIT
jgi:hypothetical protein